MGQEGRAIHVSFGDHVSVVWRRNEEDSLVLTPALSVGLTL